jgi:hypothetical protein
LCDDELSELLGQATERRRRDVEVSDSFGLELNPALGNSSDQHREKR